MFRCTVSWSRFQPTLPAWGATSLPSLRLRPVQYFNPRSPRGERHHYHLCAFDLSNISTHAPRVGSDPASPYQQPNVHKFQPTLPAWGATQPNRCVNAGAPNFNPRSPRGERLRYKLLGLEQLTFQPTLPAWGATHGQRLYSWNQENFNPRSPRGERPVFPTIIYCDLYFNPRSPRGERRVQHIQRRVVLLISTHAPRVGSDSIFLQLLTA